MRRFAILVTILFLGGEVWAQKPALDTAALSKWPFLLNPAINDDGSYVSYSIVRQPTRDETLVLRSTRDSWEKLIPGVKFGRFTSNGKFFLYKNVNDSLCIVTLGGERIEYIPNVKSYTLSNNNEDQWLVYERGDLSEEIVVRSINTGIIRRYDSVKFYLFSDDGRNLLMRIGSKNDSSVGDFIYLLNLNNFTRKLIWRGTGATDFTFNISGNQLVFSVIDRTKREGEEQLWYYRYGDSWSRLLVQGFKDIDSCFLLKDIKAFSKDGTRVFLSFTRKEELLVNQLDKKGVAVDVWSYKDEKLQSQQLKETNARMTYTGIFELKSKKVIYLESDKEWSELRYISGTSGIQQDEYVLVYETKGDVDRSEYTWNEAATTKVYLMSTRSGKKTELKVIAPSISGWGNMYLSPQAKYVVFFDTQKGEYFSYDVHSHEISNLTKGVSTDWTPREELPMTPFINIPIAAWGENDESLYVYDRTDIWKLFLDGKHNPVNITNGYGRRNNIVFRLAFDWDMGQQLGDTLILNAFDLTNKDNGFYVKSLKKEGDPQILTMGPYVYSNNLDNPSFYGRFSPLKARRGKGYLVKRESTRESPNFFFTQDFKSFRPLSNLYPEKGYIWYRATLHTWNSSDGRRHEGILYTPENFDSTKGYPVILHYYEMYSDQLNRYQMPKIMEGNMDISWFVSNGYLVFTPDIHYKMGSPGESALNYVRSAADYLSTLPYIDICRMGLQGHSFGGYETNFIVSRDSRFAAAVASSGLSDLISYYGFVMQEQSGVSAQFMHESAQLRMAGTLWDKQELYMKNSPVLYANNVNTPLLMVNNKLDQGVPFSQGVEFFTALRRLRKPVWMLQYDGEGHTLFGKAALDYTTRMIQFFDHYLKGEPAPVWMTKGIPARLKGVESGYGYDLSGYCNAHCEICHKINQGQARNTQSRNEEVAK